MSTSSRVWGSPIKTLNSQSVKLTVLQNVIFLERCQEAEPTFISEHGTLEVFSGREVEKTLDQEVSDLEGSREDFLSAQMM